MFFYKCCCEELACKFSRHLNALTVNELFFTFLSIGTKLKFNHRLQVSFDARCFSESLRRKARGRWSLVLRPLKTCQGPKPRPNKNVRFQLMQATVSTLSSHAHAMPSWLIFKPLIAWFNAMRASLTFFATMIEQLN